MVLIASLIVLICGYFVVRCMVEAGVACWFDFREVFCCEGAMYRRRALWPRASTRRSGSSTRVQRWSGGGGDDGGTWRRWRHVIRRLDDLFYLLTGSDYYDDDAAQESGDAPPLDELNQAKITVTEGNSADLRKIDNV